MTEQTPHYSLIIQWSNDDGKFIDSLPEFGANTHTHGATYDEAVRDGQDVLADLVALWQHEGRPLPQPQVFATHA